ncbi:MAG: A/G-specific adenine glycosylase, partial [Pseudomonadota bacterium]
MPFSAPPSHDVNAIRQNLLRWYRAKKRDLPWRRTRDPYRIWVSEVMLAQTRVETVIPYYERFLSEFPDLPSLARAPEERVLKQWEGLGYYSRARNLHAAARELVSGYGGELPRSSARLADLPGVGPYTSAAVASIAFGEPIAVLDGNVRRVLSRLFATNGELETLAQRVIATKDPADFNQAMMELGALVCVPKNPTCPLCPIRAGCRAFKKGVIHLFPAPKARSRPKDVFATAAVVRAEGK